MFKEYIPYTRCPLCSGVRWGIKKRVDCSKYSHFRPPLSPVLEWVECESCGHVFRPEFYTKEAWDVLCERSHPTQRVGVDLELHRSVWARVIDKVLPYQHSGVWLDVGFGSGALLITAVEYGFRGVGIDLRQANVDELNAFGIEAFRRDITAIQVQPLASVISLCDVLEHVQFPIEALEAASRNLITGGVLVVSMPNKDSPVWEWLENKNQNPYWQEMEHFHNFGRDSLYKALAQTGFRPVRFGISERYRVCMEVIAVKGIT